MLEVGDLFITDEGLLVTVEGVEDTGRVETVYNFLVEDFHTYFVSATEEGVSVSAHNAGQYGDTRTNSKGQRQILLPSKGGTGPLRWQNLPLRRRQVPVGLGIMLAAMHQIKFLQETRELQGIHVDDLGRQHPWHAHYDQHGRLIARTDWDPRNIPGIPPVHHHTYQWTRGGRIETGSHIPGQYIP